MTAVDDVHQEYRASSEADRCTARASDLNKTMLELACRSKLITPSNLSRAAVHEELDAVHEAALV
jgi:hypothetical protein